MDFLETEFGKEARDARTVMMLEYYNTLCVDIPKIKDDLHCTTLELKGVDSKEFIAHAKNKPFLSVNECKKIALIIRFSYTNVKPVMSDLLKFVDILTTSTLLEITKMWINIYINHNQEIIHEHYRENKD